SRHQIAIPVLPVAQRSPQGGDVDREIGVDHGNTRPYARQEFSPGDQIAVTFDEGDENIEGSAAQMNRLVRLQQEALLGEQAERVKPDGSHTGRTSRLVIGWRGWAW